MARKAAVKTTPSNDQSDDGVQTSPVEAEAAPALPDVETVVWAFKELGILNERTGIVACLRSVADDLIASGEAQDMQAGVIAMKPIEAGVTPEQSGDNSMNAFPYNPLPPVTP